MNTALTVSASLAQIGEFSFILAGLGVSLGLLPLAGQSLIVAGALISMAINPLVFAAVEPLQACVRRRSALARRLERPVDPLAQLPMATKDRYLSGQVVLVGYGRVGRRIGAALEAQDIPYVVAEQNRETVVRTHNGEEAGLLEREAAGKVFLGEEELARAMSRYVFERFGRSPQANC